MNSIPEHKRSGIAWGSFIGDALAMPVHWYYDRAAITASCAITRRRETRMPTAFYGAPNICG
jgi:hypothetical protein